MVCISNIVALLVVAGCPEVLSAPIEKDTSINGFQGEVVTTGSTGDPGFQSIDPKHGALIRPPAKEAELIPPGEERAIPVPPTAHRASRTEQRRITVLNATPYRFVRKSAHQNQVPDWKKSWPEYIDSGKFHVSITRYSGGDNSGKDTSTDITYEIEGTCEKMSFKVMWNPDERGDNANVVVQFQGALKTRYEKKGSRVDLGTRAMDGGVNFALAGTEDDFLARESPIGWMQDQINDIGKYPLNEIVVPRSHHAGMNEARQGVGIVYPGTTLTQTRSPYEQMKTGGVRVLDFRPYERTSKIFCAGHFSKILGVYHGMIGISLREIIDDINRFLKENPGEMIILDIHDVDSWTGYVSGPLDWDGLFPQDKFRPLDGDSRPGLWKELLRLQHRTQLRSGAKDVHKMPLDSFIGKGQSSVLIHVPEQWTRDKTFPGARNGFVSNRNFPRTAYWSDTDMADTLQAEQTATLKAKKSSGRGGQVHDSQYVLRLATVQYIFPVLALTELARDAWGRLYAGVWGASTGEVYPNWISLDAYETQEARTLATIMNRCLVAGRCGKLGGKVPRAEPLSLPSCKARREAMSDRV